MVAGLAMAWSCAAPFLDLAPLDDNREIPEVTAIAQAAVYIVFLLVILALTVLSQARLTFTTCCWKA